MSLKTRAFALGLAAASLSAPAARAADHQDGTLFTDTMTAAANANVDIGDLYAWMDSTAATLNMVMTVNPSADKTTAKFSTTSLYVFHVMSKASFSDTGVYPEVSVVCSFKDVTPQTIQCWAGDSEYVTGNPNTGVGLVSSSGKMKVFAGVRNDPFYFNLAAYKNTVASVKTTIAAITPDVAGCRQLTATQATAVKSSLSTPPADAFVGTNILALVVTLEKSLVTTPQRQTITVYGSTNKPVP